MSIVAMRGIIVRPATVGESSCVICRYVGMYEMTPNMPIDSVMPASEARVKLRSRNSHMGMIGDSTRSSTRTKAQAASTPAITRPMICGDDQSYWVPPHAETRTTEVVKTAMSASPKPSTDRSPVRVAGSSRKKSAVARIARRPRGRERTKAHRQPGPSVSQPPISGPATEDTANTEPMTPMYLPRSRAGTTLAMIAWDRIIIPPPPTPWTTRPAMSQSIVCAKKPMRDPPMKTEMAMMKKTFRPSWSPRRP